MTVELKDTHPVWLTIFVGGIMGTSGSRKRELSWARWANAARTFFAAFEEGMLDLLGPIDQFQCAAASFSVPYGDLQQQLNLARSVTSARALLEGIERGIIGRAALTDELQRVASIRIPDDDLQDQLAAARREASAETLRRARAMGIIGTQPGRNEKTAANVHRQESASILAAQ
jgi:hypothetical protein